MTETPAHPDRRTLLRGGAAAVGLTIAGGGALAACGAGTRSLSSVADSKKAAALAAGGGDEFDLRARTHTLFEHQRLEGPTVMQSFTFDNKEHELYVVQVTAKAAGNLLMTRFSPVGSGENTHWRRSGYMSVLHAGHGVSIAAHDGRLWTEADAKLSDGEAWGSRIATFRFTNKGVVDLDPQARLSHPDAYYTPSPGYDQYSCAVDPTPGHEHLIVRYSKRVYDPVHPGGVRVHYFGVFTLNDALAGNWKHPVVPTFTQPRVHGDFQGYTAKGRYLYLFSGTAAARDPRLYCYDMLANEVTQHDIRTAAAKNPGHWEAEGMAVYYPSSGKPRLFFGFATGGSGARRASLFYKQKPLR